MKLSRKISRPPRVEMLPLIDIVFLLLVFFIYAMLSMTVHRGQQIALPQSNEAELSPDSPLSVTLKSESETLLFYVNDRLIAHNDLALILQEQAQRIRDQGKEPTVHFFAEKTIAYQEIYTALDQINQAGLTSVFLQAESQGNK